MHGFLGKVSFLDKTGENRIRNEDDPILSKYVGFLIYKVPSKPSFMASMLGPLRSQGETLTPTWIGEGQPQRGQTGLRTHSGRHGLVLGSVQDTFVTYITSRSCVGLVKELCFLLTF